MTSRNLFTCIFPFALALPLSLALYGQPTAPRGTNPPAATTTDDSESESILLPEFTVTESGTSDYAAANTVTGSRVATAIRDLPYEVNVVTKEFMQDFAAYDLLEQFAYTSGFNTQDNEGAYNLRGITATNQLRNGFTRKGLVDVGSIDRAEVIKGPAAAIYGQTAPGGMINLISRRPSQRPEREVRVMAGNLGHFRADAAFSGPLTAKGRRGQTFYRLSGAAFEREYEQRFQNTKQSSVTASLIHKFSDATNIFAEYDFIRRDIGRGDPAPAVTRSTTVSARDATGALRTTTFNQRLGRYAMELFDFSLQGPAEYNDRHMHTGSVHLEHRFSQVFSLRAAASVYDRWYWRGRYLVGPYRIADRSIVDREPEYQSLREYGRGAQVDFLARYTTKFLAPMGHNTLVTYDYRFEGANDWARNLPTSADPRNVRVLSVDNPDYFMQPYDPAAFTRFAFDNYRANDNHSLVIQHQAFALENRLIGLFSVRYDIVDITSKSWLTGIAREATRDAARYKFGLNYRVTPALTLYGSSSSSFQSTTTTNRFGEILPSEKGSGLEGGVKLSMFGQRLNGTIAWFYIDKENEPTTQVFEVEVLDAAGQPVIDPVTGMPSLRIVTDNAAEGRRRSKGIDADFNYAISKSLQLIANVAYTDARRVSVGRDIDLIGRWVNATPRHSGGLAGKYTRHTGPLRGLAVTFGVRYRGHLFPDTLGGGLDFDKDNINESHDGRRTVQLPSMFIGDVGVSYRWKKNDSRIQHSLQVNVKNVGGKRYLTDIARAADGRTILTTYGLKF